jgi:PAS domain S-box-containing protein
MVWWISAQVILSTILIFYHTQKVRKDKALEYQSFMIALGIAIPATTGVVSQFIMPIVLRQPALPVTSTFMTCFSLATVIALRRFRLFAVSELLSNERAMEMLPVMVLNISPSGRVNYINAYAREVLGVKTSNTRAIVWEDVIRPCDDQHRDNFIGALNKAIEGKIVSDVETAIITRDGQMDVLMGANPIINNNEVHGLLISMRDITEIKQTHEKVASSEAQLRVAQRLARIGSWEWDIENSTVKWSDELYRIFGYKPGEVSVDYDTYLSLLPPTETEMVKQVIERAYNDKRPFVFTHRMLRFADHEEIYVHARGSVVTDKEGKPIKMHGTAQDITEIRKREDMLQRQNEELQKINAELDGFVYSVSHDLRSPLTSMMGLIDIAQEECTQKPIRDYLSMLKSSVSKLDAFIMDILNYSRNARTDVQKEQIDFNELLSDLLSGFKLNKRTDLNLKTAVRGEAFYGDRSRLSIILNNLVGNAIRYADPHAPEKLVEIDVTVTREQAVIKVIDNGIGIPEDMHEKVFDMFFRGSKESVGSGLGLYIVKEAVQKLNGRINLSSRPGQGTCFTLEVPNDYAGLSALPRAV